jgi:DNA-binding MarR family transcriptional regulator
VVATADVVTEMMRLAAGVRRVARRRLAASPGMTPLPDAQRELLLVVEARPGIGVAAAATELGLASNSVSTLVNVLVEADLLRREPDPADRRAVHLTLTETAGQRLRIRRSARAQLLNDALDRGGPDDRRAIEAALPAMRRLLAELREERTA